MTKETEPKTLQQAVIYFSNPQNCLNYLVSRRWPDGVICPRCGRKDPSFLAKQNKWQCRSGHPQRQFSIKTGTIFEDSPLGLDKWLTTVWMVTNCKNGVSSYEIHRAIGVTQKTAWFMLHRIRLAMQTGTFTTKLNGFVEVDETYIGGRARNMHKSVIAKKFGGSNTGCYSVGKVAVMGLLERHGNVRAHVIMDNSKETLRASIDEHVEKGSSLFTDGWRGYKGVKDQYVHGVIDHAEKYVDGSIHTNGIENFWSLLKRTLRGTYISVEPFHLFRYLDEQSMRFNSRKGTDSERFNEVTERVTGKRLTYKELTGKMPGDEKLSC